MGVTETVTKVLYSGDGLSFNFSFPFKAFLDRDVSVSLIDLDTRDVTPQAVGVDFTVERFEEGGTVTFLSPPAFGFRILIKRTQELTQDLDLSTTERLKLQMLEDQLDAIVMMIQEQATEIQRTAKVPEDSNLDVAFPLEALEDYVLQWDGTSGKLRNYRVNFAEQLQILEDALLSYIDLNDDIVTEEAQDYADQGDADTLQAANDYADQLALDAGAVLSVAGKTGDVVLEKADISDFDEDDYVSLSDVQTLLGQNSINDRDRGNHTGQQFLTSLHPTGAVTGQVVTFNGSNWAAADPASGGVTSHSALDDLGNDDHTQYHTDARGDVRYNTKSEITTFLAGKANTVHDHPPTQIIRQLGSHESQYLGVGNNGAGYDAAYPMLARNAHVSWWIPNPNAPTSTVVGMGNLAAQGTATGKAINNQTFEMAKAVPRIGYRVTTAATSAVAAWKPNSNSYYISGGSYALRAGICSFIFGPDTGLAASSAGTLRCFAGLSNAAGNQTDQNPDTVAQVVGVGARSTNANWHVIIRQSGVNTQNIDTGIPKSFSTDDTDLYQLIIQGSFSSNLLTIIFRTLLPFGIGTEFITTINEADLPDNTQLLSPRVFYSVGGTSSVIGLNMAKFYSEQYYAAYGYL